MKQRVASLFWSMEVWVSWGAWKVHATLGKILSQDIREFFYIQMEDKTPRYEYNWTIINLNEQFYIGFGIKKIISLWKMAYKVAKICKEKHIDTIIWQGDFFFMVTALQKIFYKKTKTIALVHTTLRIWPWRLQKILNICLNMNDYIVCISDEEKEYLLKQFKIPSDKLYLIHNSLDIVSVEKKLEKIWDDISNENENMMYIKNSQCFKYIAVGRYTYQKNYECLIEAFYKTYKKNTNIELYILGDWDEFQKITSIVKMYHLEKNVFLLGNKNNPLEYMIHADCFVMSSRFEWFPMVLLEAAVVWLPIVSLACPTGPQEVIGENEGGICVPYTNNLSNDSEMLSEAMLEIIQKDRKSISERNKKYALHFSNESIQWEREKLLQKI